ncbi:MAG: dihydrofolate reductase [Candidatus Paceibacteria bacterium]|jgi:dihydrofolate reductase
MSQTSTNQAPIVIVVGLGQSNRALGMNNELLWHVPDDLKRFKELTLGHPIIMGRKTFESILKILGKPLPGRSNIVVTRDLNYIHEGVRVAHSLDEAIATAESEHPTEIHIGGGAELYRHALPLVSRLHITWFLDDKEADTFFPEFAKEFKIVAKHPIQTHEGLQFQWIDYVRKA